eukprot:306939_1
MASDSDIDNDEWVLVWHENTDSESKTTDENLTKAQQDYSPQQNKEFEDKYDSGYDHDHETKEQPKPNIKSKYEMHPLSTKIIDGTDDKVLVMIRRDKAPNPVVYRARFVDQDIKNNFDSNPVEIFWLKIANGCIVKHRKSGKKDDRVELSYIESQLAYGIKYQQIEQKQQYKISFNALPKWSCILKMCPIDAKPKLFGKILGEECYLKDIHITLKKNTWLGTFTFPTVEYITLKGFKCDGNVYIEYRIQL